MGLFDRFFKKAPASSPIRKVNGLWGAGYGFTVNAASAEKFSAVFACVRTYERIMSSLPIEVKAQGKAGKPDVDVTPISRILSKPNSYQDWASFISYMTASLELKGNALALIRSKNAMPSALMPIPWDCCNVLVNEAGEPVYDITDPDLKIYDRFDAPDVIHFKINNRTRYYGLSPIEVAANSIGLGLSAEHFGSSFFSQGGNIKGVLETEKNLSEENLKAIRKEWNDFYTGEANAHKTPLLEGGLKYRPIGISPNEAQFIETRVFEVQEVARFFGVPPSLIGENSRNTFSNGEQQNLQFLTYSIAPLCTIMEKEMEAKLLKDADRDKVDIKFNLNSLMRGDMAARASFAQTMCSTGIYTRNEIRAMEGLQPLQGLDDPLDPAYLTGKNQQQDNNGKD